MAFVVTIVCCRIFWPKSKVQQKPNAPLEKGLVTNPIFFVTVCNATL